MTTEAPAATESAEEKINQLRELFADAPEVGKTALEKVLSRLASDASQAPPPPVESAGRVGSRLGKVSELTIIVPFAPGGAQRLRAFLRLFGGNLAGADEVGTVHDMRFVFLDNDTRMLFATAYVGDWDAYIDDFATKIPDFLDIIDSAWEGWPGIRSPQAKDGATFTIPQQPVRRRIHGIETFNVLRGGEYFFLPSLSALRWLADLR